MFLNQFNNIQFFFFIKMQIRRKKSTGTSYNLWLLFEK